MENSATLLDDFKRKSLRDRSIDQQTNQDNPANRIAKEERGCDKERKSPSQKQKTQPKQCCLDEGKDAKLVDGKIHLLDLSRIMRLYIPMLNAEKVHTI